MPLGCHAVLRLTLGLEFVLFVSCNGPKKNRVCRSKKKIHYFFVQKCVLCMFFFDWESAGLKKTLGLRDF